MKITTEITRRTVSGTCFALAAIVPVAYYFLLNPFEKGGLPLFGGSMMLTVAVPIFIAVVCGLSLGAQILDPEERVNVFKAIGLGSAVSLLSYFLMFSASGIVLILIGGDVFGVLTLSVFLFFYGLLFLGWLVALSGAATGCGLYLIRRKMLDREQIHE